MQSTVLLQSSEWLKALRGHLIETISRFVGMGSAEVQKAEWRDHSGVSVGASLSKCMAPRRLVSILTWALEGP